MNKRIFPFLAIVSLPLFCLTGCCLPTLTVDRLPSPGLQHIRVIDETTGLPVPDVTVSCLVFSYSAQSNWLDDNSGEPSMLDFPIEMPEARIPYRSCDRANFEISSESYWGSGKYCSMPPAFYDETETRHFSLIVIEAPGYQSMAVRGLDDQSFLMVAQLSDTQPYVFRDCRSGPPDPTSKIPQQMHRRSEGLEKPAWWPEIKGSVLEVKLVRSDSRS